MFTIIERGRGDYMREMASTPFSDVARIIALALAERFHRAESTARHGAKDGTCYYEVLSDGTPYARIVLAQSDVRVWQWCEA